MIDPPDAPRGAAWPPVDLLSLHDVGLRRGSRGLALPLCRLWPGLLNINTAGLILHIQRHIKHSVDKPIRVVAGGGRVVWLLHPLSFDSVSSRLQWTSCLGALEQLEEQKCFIF